MNTIELVLGTEIIELDYASLMILWLSQKFKRLIELYPFTSINMVLYGQCMLTNNDMIVCQKEVFVLLCVDKWIECVCEVEKITQLNMCMFIVVFPTARKRSQAVIMAKKETYVVVEKESNQNIFTYRQNQAPDFYGVLVIQFKRRNEHPFRHIVVFDQ